MRVPDIAAEVTGLFVGCARERWPGRPPSAIGKTAVERPLALGQEGFAEDEQADRTVHGGPEKAVHHYAAEHYDLWRVDLPDLAARMAPGVFGENVSTKGLTEETLHIGDVLSLGSAVVQVAQGRQPCWKLNAHVGNAEMARRVQTTGRTGWYYRVLEAGHVRRGDRIVLRERPHPDWSVMRVTRARFDRRLDTDEAEVLATLRHLSSSWRAAFRRKTVADFLEDDGPRLEGPA